MPTRKRAAIERAAVLVIHSRTQGCEVRRLPVTVRETPAGFRIIGGGHIGDRFSKDGKELRPKRFRVYSTYRHRLEFAP